MFSQWINWGILLANERASYPNHNSTYNAPVFKTEMGNIPTDKAPEVLFVIQS